MMLSELCFYVLCVIMALLVYSLLFVLLEFQMESTWKAHGAIITLALVIIGAFYGDVVIW